ncbi:uncharacterized protein LOC131247011 [Magnolia sinica]|uniref:uncharacterized protein LOC131247011 n=1 Tax=Magnolia sinica TaxID=86752 RepID=UPI00265A57F4|nr:uncharacterized protein LOC131247011 [Magnolia sinica]
MVIADRLSKILPNTISVEQGAFIQGKSITESCVLAQEMFKDINRWVRGGNIFIKLDKEKAYDRLDWGFLLAVLRRLGFGEKWITMVKKCWSNSLFSVLLNGEACGFFRSSKGLCQGDLISLGLFILAAEVLSRGFSQPMSNGACLPFKTRRNCRSVSHMLFAYDTLLLVNGSCKTLNRIKSLDCYHRASGQRCNDRKSFFILSAHQSEVRSRVILKILGFSKCEAPFTYLGMPIFKGRSKSSYFQPIMEKIHQRITGWKLKFLTQAGKITLINYVLGNILVHTIAATDIPRSILGELDKASANLFIFLGLGGRQKALPLGQLEANILPKIGGRARCQEFE